MTLGKSMTFQHRISIVLLSFISVGCLSGGSEAKRLRAAEFFAKKEVVALAEAASAGDRVTLTRLVGAGADVNTQGVDGMSPLLWALIKQSKPGFTFLLEHGANPNLLVKDGASVMWFAAMHEDPTFLRLALEYKGNPNLVNPFRAQTPIYESVMNLREQNIALFIEWKADLDFRDRTGSTPMMTAASLNRFDYVYAMLIGGADPSIKNNWGNTIGYFLRRGNMDPKHELFRWRAKVIALLKERGVSLD
jgi:ankyrin repeat protein